MLRSSQSVLALYKKLTSLTSRLIICGGPTVRQLQVCLMGAQFFIQRSNTLIFQVTRPDHKLKRSLLLPDLRRALQASRPGQGRRLWWANLVPLKTPLVWGPARTSNTVPDLWLLAGKEKPRTPKSQTPPHKALRNSSSLRRPLTP